MNILIETDSNSTFTPGYTYDDWNRCIKIIGRMSDLKDRKWADHWIEFSKKMCGKEYSDACTFHAWMRFHNIVDKRPYLFGARIWMDDGEILCKVSDGCPFIHDMWAEYSLKEDSKYFSYQFSIETWENYLEPNWIEKRKIYERYFHNEKIVCHFFKNGFTLAIDDEHDFKKYEKEYKKKEMNEIVYKLSDLVAENKMPSFKVFKNKVYLKTKYFIPLKTLHKLYAFIEVMQNHPRQNELASALKNVFCMVLNDMFDYS